MNSKKNVLINIGIIAFIIIAFVAVNFFVSEPNQKVLSFESVGLQVPLTALNGAPKAPAPETITLKEYRGQSILIHFWASWCESCASDQKAMERIAKNFHGNSPVKIMGIASGDTSKAIEQSGIIKNSSFPHFLDETGNLALAMGVKTLPQTLLIDPKGRVLMQHARPLDERQIERIETQMSKLSINRVSEFMLENSFGVPVNQTTYENKVWVANFIFTSCPGQCPMMTAKMRLLQEEFKNDDRFRLVSVSVDPETDSRVELKKYQLKHKVDKKKWFFLRGPMDEVKKLLVNSFKLGTMEDPKLHSEKFILVGLDNKIQGYYDFNSTASFEKLKADITQLLK